MYSNPGEVYSLARRLIQECRANGHESVADKLGDALCVGTSALETLGAIVRALVEHYELLKDFTDSDEIDAAVLYVDKVFGRGPVYTASGSNLNESWGR